MTWRRAAIYWACFLGLAAYYFVAERAPAVRAAAHLTRAPFLNIPDEQVEALEIQRGDLLIRCRKVDGHWQVSEPVGSNASSDLITGLVSNLTQMPDVEVVSEATAELAQYGLAPPLSQITLRLDGGKRVTVRVGTRNPAGTAVYAQRSDSPQVFLIGLNVGYYEELLVESLRPQAAASEGAIR